MSDNERSANSHSSHGFESMTKIESLACRALSMVGYGVMDIVRKAAVCMAEGRRPIEIPAADVERAITKAGISNQE